MLGARVEETGATIRIHGQLPHVRCDRICVREIFSNLLSNGMKYNDKVDKWVEVGCIKPGVLAPEFYNTGRTPFGLGDQCIYYVRDNGIGIDRRHYAQVFKMFKRLHTKDAFGGGNGAGLTIVKKMVEQHDGQIWIDSEVGNGAVFYFTLSGAAAVNTGHTL